MSKSFFTLERMYPLPPFLTFYGDTEDFIWYSIKHQILKWKSHEKANKFIVTCLLDNARFLNKLFLVGLQHRMVEYRRWVVNANKYYIWSWLHVAFKLMIPRDVRMLVSRHLILPTPEDFLYWRTMRVDKSMNWLKQK